MTDNFIKLNKDNILRLAIKTYDDKNTGEFLEFDLESIELPLRYQELLEKDKKNKAWLNNQMLIIDKRQDVKGKKFLSKNEEDKIRAIKEFFVKETEVYNMFLGENGVQKILNGRDFTWTTLQEIDEIIEKQIFPYIDVNMENIQNKIVEKYNMAIQKSKGIIE